MGTTEVTPEAVTAEEMASQAEELIKINGGDKNITNEQSITSRLLQIKIEISPVQIVERALLAISIFLT
jgi:hypothetical protein